MAETLGVLLKSHVIEAIKDVDASEMFYYVKEEKKPELEYYKNSIIHCFIPQAFVALSLLTGNREISSREKVAVDYAFLKKVFRYEFIFDENMETPETEVNTILTDFFRRSLLVKSDVKAGYSLTRPGLEQMTVWANLAKTFIESYWIAARAIIERQKNGKKRSDMLKSMTYLGQRYHRLGLIDHLEAVSQINFKNAIRMIEKDFPLSAGQSEEKHREAFENLTLFSKRLHEFSQYHK